MSTRSEDYRAKATEIENVAAEVEDTMLRQSFLQLARQWVELAEHQTNTPEQYGVWRVGAVLNRPGPFPS
jgi:hypothetical protein